jgi:hypothetical protein
MQPPTSNLKSKTKKESRQTNNVSSLRGNKSKTPAPSPTTISKKNPQSISPFVSGGVFRVVMKTPDQTKLFESDSGKMTLDQLADVAQYTLFTPGTRIVLNVERDHQWRCECGIEGFESREAWTTHRDEYGHQGCEEIGEEEQVFRFAEERVDIRKRRVRVKRTVRLDLLHSSINWPKKSKIVIQNPLLPPKKGVKPSKQMMLQVTTSFLK